MLNKDYVYKFFLYHLLEKKINLKNKSNQIIKLDFKEDISTCEVIEIAKDFKTENFTKRIIDILKEIYEDFDSEAEKILEIDKKKINHEDNSKNLNIYRDFLKNLDNESKSIEIVIDDYYKINITNVLLSNNLSKIYKINDDKKDKIIDILNGDYKSYKYSSLQEELDKDENFKNVKILNGDNKTEISDLNNVTITITEDKGKDKNRVIVPKQCTIEFKAGNNLFIIDRTKYPTSKIIDFSDSEGGITTDTNIEKYINDNYKEINGKSIKITPIGHNDGKFKDETVVTVTINEVIAGITSAKDPNKVYVKVNFEVSDKTKYKLKENILKLNNNELELEKDSKYEDLIDKVKANLGGTSFKDGFTVLYNNSDFTSGNNLTNDGVYTFKLDNLDTNFVEEIVKDKPEKPEDKPEDKPEEEEHKEDDNGKNKEETKKTEQGVKNEEDKKGCGCNNKCSGGNKN